MFHKEFEMAKSTYLYEVLFRLGPDGLVGAHAVYVDRYTDDETGQIVADRRGPARPIKPASEAATLVGDTVATFVEQVDRLRSENDMLRST